MAAAATILVIDDDKTFTAMIGAALRAAGYRAVVAFDAMQGFMLAQREQPDLVILDLSMPAGGGMGVLDHLRHASRTLNVPVVIVTGTPTPRVESEAKEKGVVAVLSKPVDTKALIELVKQTLEEDAP
jgi:CheY-like chemotaxis protein